MQKGSLRQLFGLPNFRLLGSADAISDFGSRLTNFTALLLINERTGSAAALALLGILMLLPQVTIGIMAGVVVDRYDRKRIMILSNFLRAGLVASLALVSLGGDLWLLYLLLFAQAVVGTFFNPAHGALLPVALPKEHLLAANSLNQMTFMLMTVLGSAVAGVCIGVFNNYWLPFLLDAVTFLVSCWLVYLVKVDARPPAASEVKITAPGAFFGQLGEGFRVIGTNKLVLGVIVGCAFAMLGFGAINILSLPMNVNELKLPPEYLGLINFAQVAGMVISSLLLAAKAASMKPEYIVGGGMLILGLMIGTISIVNAPWQLAFLLFAVGLAINPLQAAIVTVLQTQTEDAVRGRVFATFETIVSVANLTSMIFAGLFGELVGVRVAHVYAGSCALLAAGFSYWLMRSHRPVSENLTKVEAKQI
jgi:MFS transporter, DHA3 family, macrolide efflux protein